MTSISWYRFFGVAKFFANLLAPFDVLTVLDLTLCIICWLHMYCAADLISSPVSASHTVDLSTRDGLKLKINRRITTSRPKQNTNISVSASHAVDLPQQKGLN